MKILFITKDFTNRIEKSSYYLLEALKKKANVVTSSEDGNIETILKKIRFEPDFILLNDMKPSYCPYVRGFHRLHIPVGAIVHDLKYKPNQRRQFYKEENIRFLFTHYRNAFKELFPELIDRMIWFPHHVPTDIFNDYHLKRDIDILMMGSIYPRLYPMRAKFYEILKDEPNFVYHEHPGYLKIEDWQNVYACEKYAREINRAKIFVTCHSIDHFPLLKYFEVLACKTLLVATPSKELEELGFIDGETFVAVNEENIKEKIAYYLKNEKERKKISERGYEMVHNHHSTDKRVESLITRIKEIVKQNQ